MENVYDRQRQSKIQYWNGIAFRADLLNHASKFDGFNKTQVRGTHNKVEFENLQNTHNVKIVSTTPTSTMGIYEIEYQVPSYHPQNQTQMVGYKKVERKTVYDPTIYSDNEMLEMAQKAAVNGYDNAVLIFKSSNGKERGYDTEYNGIKFKAYLNKDDNGKIFIDNVHVIK
ncbi:CdiA family toxin C-terminal domain-containing protein [Moraxella oblonga]|uniref:CdiA family toxin C-terminal domain-containing protein n=1 Tax=Moraxella oblonga TaxID=200413 RepID=UPI00083627F1|nr:CdiA family toxin C-terminal domain-containing protein [Moraxella oblonga]